MSKVSVICPVYNVEKYLSKCIDSILNQTFVDFELILINDGSLDNSGVICDKYVKVDSRVSVIHKVNGGISSARNCGIENAKGEYIVFIDSDDFIASDMLEVLYKKIQQYNCDIVQCGYKKVYQENMNCENLMNIIEGDIVYESLDIVKNFFTGRNVSSIVWDKIYRTELFKNIRFPVGQVMEDAFILTDIYYKAKKICIVKDIKYFYLQRDGSIMNTKKSKHHMVCSFLAYKNRIDVSRVCGNEELIDISLFGLSSDFLQYYRIINENKIYSSRTDMLDELKSWYRKYRLSIYKSRYISFKMKFLLEFLYYVPSFVGYVVLGQKIKNNN